MPSKFFYLTFYVPDMNYIIHWHVFVYLYQPIHYARNTPGSICQYKEDGLVSRPPSLLTSMRQPMHGSSCSKSQLKSTCLTAKFGSFLDHAEAGEKRQNVISSSVQHPISLIFAIHVCFIIHVCAHFIHVYTSTDLTHHNSFLGQFYCRVFYAKLIT